MTFAEKARKEHPECVDIELGYPGHLCPHAFGYEDARTLGDCAGCSCRQCWNREISTEKPVCGP